jgi:light-harvesting complex I chlorophyll a/b binding protein 1
VSNNGIFGCVVEYLYHCMHGSRYDTPSPHTFGYSCSFHLFCTHSHSHSHSHNSPLNLVKNGPYGAPVDNFRHYRGVEVKHGRIAMAATLGMLVQENSHFAGALSPSANLDFKDVPNGLAALNVVPLAGWVQMAVVIGLHEVFVKERPNKAPGDFGTGYFGVALDDQSSTQLRLLNVEVSNGRLAMLGILGMFASEIIHGEALTETHMFG